MQILPTAHPQLVAASKDLTEPAKKVRIGSSIRRGYLDAPCADLGTALNRYSESGRDTRQLSASLHTLPEDSIKDVQVAFL
jgi:hypothetical protein